MIDDWSISWAQCLVWIVIYCKARLAVDAARMKGNTNLDEIASSKRHEEHFTPILWTIQ